MRRELFKYYYAEQLHEKYGLYQKADAAEFMQSFLELAHFVLNQKPGKKTVDCACDPPCYVHKYLRLNLVKKMQCKCSDKIVEEPYDNNYFAHFINA